jgi:antitoxin ParD1/3/4
MPTRNISLTAPQDAFIDRMVRTGTYQNASEAVRDALRLLQQRRAEDAARLKALRNAVRTGIADLDAGRFKSFESTDDLHDYLTGLSERIISGHET